MSHPNQQHPQQPYIEFRGVSKSFGDHKVLDDVSFLAMPGETLCILGRSGVGKSVSLQHIMGFLKPDAGRVIVAFEDVTDYAEEDLERIRKKVTMVFQSGALFDSLTVGENILFSLELRDGLNFLVLLPLPKRVAEELGVVVEFLDFENQRINGIPKTQYPNVGLQAQA